MCIIAAKPAGVKMPDERTLENMWYSNPNGAGLMYPITLPSKRKGKGETTVIQIDKGYMKFSDFMARLEERDMTMDLTNTPIVMHFRITTHGGTCPENTHPFPVTDSIGQLKMTRTTTMLGIAHNGIIHSVTPRKGISDTMEYTATQLAPLTRAMPKWWENRDALRMVENAIGSKLAVLTPEGDITTIGKFIEDDGILYSNSSYLPCLYDYKYSSCKAGSSGWSTFSYADFADYDDADAPFDEADMEPLPKALMLLLDSPGAYVVGEEGELMEGDNFAIDKDSTVYWFDPELAYWTEMPGMTAYNEAGLPLRYDEEVSIVDSVLTEEQTQLWYDYLGI